MREIKYRAWIKNADKMVDVIAIDLEKEDICWIFDDYVNWEQERVWIGFDDIALMQSTGLKDKNGKEIYEGDIVLDERGNKAYIAFLRQEMGYVLVFEKHDSRLGHRNRGSGYDSDLSLEVIGNIYENPELMV